MLDSQIYGMNAWGHHLTNVLLHAANTVLLFLVLRRITGAQGSCLVVALIFGLHPLRVESVAWVSERKDVLGVFFWMLTLLMYARYVESQNVQSGTSKFFYGLTLFCFASGLMSKGLVVTLPCVLLLLDYWPLQRHQQKRVWSLILEKVPFVLLILLASVLTYAAQKSWGFVQTMDKYSLDVRLANAVVSYLRYLGKMFWPVHLAGYYPHPGHWPLLRVIGATTFLVVASVLTFVARRKRPWLLVGWLWYLGTLVPMIGIVQVAHIAMANRYAYIPMIGILLVLVWEIREWTKEWRYKQIVWGITATLMLLPCIFLCRQQIRDFKDSITFWRSTYKITGDKDVALYALGMALSDAGRTDEAIEVLQTSLQAKPERGMVHYNLAFNLGLRGRVDEAIKEYYEAIKYSPQLKEAHYNLGGHLWRTGRTNEAIAQFAEVVKIYPHDGKEFRALASALNLVGRIDEAIFYFQQAVQEQPNDAGLHYELGKVLADKKRFAESVIQFQEVLRLDPQSTGARAYLDSLKITMKGLHQ